jgi:tetratricopeptide (TPR) repeat protein
MRFVTRCVSPFLFLAACFGFPALCAADSLVTVDGEILMGPVTQSGGGYTVQTSEGPVSVPSERVRKVLYDHPPANAAPSPPAPGSAAASTHKTPDPRTIEALIAQGQSAMTAAEYGDARDAFKDALQVDHQNPLAARGLGFAYIALNKPVKALEPLEIAAQKPPLDRSLVMAISAALVANHNSMRAVRYLVTYMQAHPDPVDEPMLNALGIALSQAEGVATRSPLYRDAGKLYRKQNAELEAANEDKRRWGVEWLDKKDVDAREADRAKVQQKVDAALGRLQLAQVTETNAESALNQAVTAMGRRNDAAITTAEKNVTTAKTDLSKAQSDYDQVCKELAAVPGPTFPQQIMVDDADLIVVPGAVAGAPANPVSAGGPVGVNIKPARPILKPVDPNDQPDPAPKPKPTQDDATPTTPVQDTPAKPPANAGPARHLTRYAVGFAIAPDVLVTAAGAVEDASTITVTFSDGKTATATVLRSHHADGLALLKVDNANLPCVAIAKSADDSGLSCLGYPEVDLFNPVPRSMDLTANAQGDNWTVRFTGSPRLPGGPILQNNAVVGVELGDRDSEPTSVPAATLQQLTALVGDSANAGTASPDPKKAIVQIAAER